MKFSPSCHFLPLGPNILLSTPFYNLGLHTCPFSLAQFSSNSSSPRSCVNTQQHNLFLLTVKRWLAPNAAPSWRATSFPRLLVQYIHNYPPRFEDLLQPPLPTWGHALPSWQATGIIHLRALLCLLNFFCCIWVLLNLCNDHTSTRSSFYYYVTAFRD
jgi:hypothetical protein